MAARDINTKMNIELDQKSVLMRSNGMSNVEMNQKIAK